MSVYTVHQPPVPAGDLLPEAERIVFVRDGFSFWAFLLAPLWMLWHRMWIVLVGYVALAAVLEILALAFGVSPSAVSVIGLMISLLIGLEASTLRRFTLRRRGFANAGIVSGDDLEDAERRFFDAWLHESSARHAAEAPPMPATAMSAAAPRVPQSSGVIGLFPEPGAHR